MRSLLPCATILALGASAACAPRATTGAPPVTATTRPTARTAPRIVPRAAARRPATKRAAAADVATDRTTPPGASAGDLVHRRPPRSRPATGPGAARYRQALASYRGAKQRWAQAAATARRIDHARDTGATGKIPKLQRQRRARLAEAGRLAAAARTQLLALVNDRARQNRPWLEEALFTLAEIQRTLAHHAQRDGRTADVRRHHAEFTRHVGQLSRRYPRSRHLPGLALVLADQHFHGRRFSPAITAYQGVARRDAKLRPYANYKIGWCYLNLNQHPRALLQFLRVVKMKGAGRALQKAARQDAVRTYVPIGKVQLAHKFLTKLTGDPAEIKRLYLNYVSTLFAQARNRDTIASIREALRRWPRDPQRCEWAHTALNAAFRMANPQAVGVIQALLRGLSKQLTAQLGASHPRAVACAKAVGATGP